MARKSLLPGYERVTGDKAERVRNIKTGEVISDRQYKKLAREASGLTPVNAQGQKITSNEALAKFNKQTAPTQAAARPARGRKSARKESKEVQVERAQALQEQERKKKAENVERKNQQALQRKIEAAKNKKIQVRKVSAQGFKYDPRFKKKVRRTAAQYDFESADQLWKMWNDARRVSGVRYWGVGVRGIDERNAKHLDAWLAGLFDFSYKPANGDEIIPNPKYDPEDEDSEEFIENPDYVPGDIDLDELLSDFQERKPYFVFTSFFLHIAKESRK